MINLPSHDKPIPDGTVFIPVLIEIFVKTKYLHNTLLQISFVQKRYVRKLAGGKNVSMLKLSRMPGMNLYLAWDVLRFSERGKIANVTSSEPPVFNRRNNIATERT